MAAENMVKTQLPHRSPKAERREEIPCLLTFSCSPSAWDTTDRSKLATQLGTTACLGQSPLQFRAEQGRVKSDLRATGAWLAWEGKERARRLTEGATGVRFSLWENLVLVCVGANIEEDR
jgi:hypothetical protein